MTDLMPDVIADAAVDALARFLAEEHATRMWNHYTDETRNLLVQNYGPTARRALEVALPHLRAHQVEVSTKVGYALGRAQALKEVADEMTLSSDWQLDDPRVGYVDVQIDKDTYRLLLAAREPILRPFTEGKAKS